MIYLSYRNAFVHFDFKAAAAAATVCRPPCSALHLCRGTARINVNATKLSQRHDANQLRGQPAAVLELGWNPWNGGSASRTARA